jgi:hypothetical protein
VDLADTAYAHGAIEVERDSAPRVLRENWGVNPNRLGVGIEHEGMSGDLMTEAQFDASTRLAAWLFATELSPAARAAWPWTGAHPPHGEISPRSRARCPGYPEETFIRYVARVRALLAAPVAPPALPPVPPLNPEAMHQRTLIDAITVQAAALDELAARAAIQAANLRRLVQSG